MRNSPRPNIRAALLFLVAIAFPVAASAAGGPELVVSSQILKVDSILISRAWSQGAGWVSVHLSENDEPGRLIGLAPLVPGENLFLPVKLDLAGITPRLVAVLHSDAGLPGSFEYPGPDAAVTVGDSPVRVSFFLVGCRGELSCDGPVGELDSGFQ